jgi:hypothetical protein
MYVGSCFEAVFLVEIIKVAIKIQAFDNQMSASFQSTVVNNYYVTVDIIKVGDTSCPPTIVTLKAATYDAK